MKDKATARPDVLVGRHILVPILVHHAELQGIPLIILRSVSFHRIRYSIAGSLARPLFTIRLLTSLSISQFFHSSVSSDGGKILGP